MDIDPLSDWPELNFSAALATRDARLQRWVDSSPRRSLSPSGQFLMVARERAWPGPDAFVVNRAPVSAREAVWSIDMVWTNSASRVVLPPGVVIDVIEMLDEE